MGAAAVLAGTVFSEVISFTQSEWKSRVTESEAVLPQTDWAEYSAKDAGVAAADDIRLEPAVYAVTQTSHDGSADSCDTENCSAGGGFNGTGSVKTGISVSGAGENASMQLSAQTSGTGWSQQLLGSLDTYNASGIALSGNMVYIADDTQGLKLINITTPSAPTLTATYNTPGKAVDVAVSGNYAYLAADAVGLQVINITNPSAPALAGTYNTPGKALDVVVAGNYAYVADEKKGLRVVDISNPTLPVSAGVYDTGSNVLGVAVSGNYAYVAEDKTGLKILNISTPASPSLVGSFAASGTANGGIDLIGNYVYLTLASGGFQIINVSVPSSPVSAEVIITAGTATDLDIVGNVAYMAMGTTGLVTFNLSAPSSPVLLGTYNTAGTASGVVAAGNTVYVADGSTGLQVVEVVQDSGYSASGTFESPVMDIGSDVYKLTTIAADAEVPAASLPVGMEISSSMPGLVALWHMNAASTSDTTVTDAAGAKNGSISATPGGANNTSAAMWAAGGKLGSAAYNALEFDGTDDYVSVGNVGGGVQSVVFWINHSNPAAGDEILELSASRSVAIATSTGEITAVGFGSAAIYVDGRPESAVLSTGWHHVAVVGSSSVSATGVNLGRVGTGYMAGKLDEVALFSRPLTAAEIEMLYRGAGLKFQVAASSCSNGADKAPKCTTKTGWGDADTPFVGPDGTADTYFEGPLALLHFNEGSGSVAQDFSGHGSHGEITIGNSGTQASIAQAWTGGASGAMVGLGSQGISLDGTDDYIKVEGVAQGVVSVELWLNHAKPADGDAVMELGAGHAVTIKKGSGEIQANGFGSAVVYVDGSADSAVLTEGWHHVAIVSDAAVSASEITLGRAGTDYMAGSLDEVSLYGYALTKEDVLLRYNNGLGRQEAVFGGLSGAGLDNKQFVKYKAFLSTASMLAGPQLNSVAVGYSAVPAGAGLVSSIFDTEDGGSFLTNIAWSEKLGKHDVRLQVATSGDKDHWNYCGPAACSSEGWLDFAASADNYYTKSAGDAPHRLSQDAVNDRYLKYKIWLMSSDGKTTPTADDIVLKYDTAHLELFGPDGKSATMTAQAGKAFSIIINVKDSSGKIIKTHDGSKTLKVTASSPQPDKGACRSSFNASKHTEFIANASFASGKAVLKNVMLCDDTVEGPITINVAEITGGVLKSTADLTISDITEGEEETVSATLTWDPNENCKGFNHYEVWYGTAPNTALGVGEVWDNSNDPTLALCATTTTTITGLIKDTQYYFKLYTIDDRGKAREMEITGITLTEDLGVEEGEEAPEEAAPGEEGYYEVLVKLGDNVSSNKAEDARGSYKHGDVIMVMPAGHNWSDTERSSFLIIRLKLTPQEAADLVNSDNLRVKRRGKKVNLEKFGLSERDGHRKDRVDAVRDMISHQDVQAGEIIEAK